MKHCFNPIQDGPIREYSRSKKASLPKTCHTRPTMIKLGTDVPYLKKIQKIYESRDSIFSLEIRKFCYIKKYRYISNFDT